MNQLNPNTAVLASRYAPVDLAGAPPPLPPKPPTPPAVAVPPPPPATPSSRAEDEIAQDPRLGLGDSLRNLPSWLVSMVFHLVLVITMALWVARVERVGTGDGEDLIASHGETTMDLEAPEELSESDPIEIPLVADTTIEPLDTSDLLRPEEIEPTFADPAAGPEDGSDIATVIADKGTLPAGGGDGVADISITGDPADLLKGRLSNVNRAALVKLDGGTEESEAAVGRALKWLANHQLADGSWSFNHRRSPKCGNKCDHPGNLEDARIAATAMALLPFLGQGHTQKTGDFKPVVERGLYFLTRSMKTSGNNGSLHEPGGRMYGHGLASIVLCEAYGLTRDSSLKTPAQASINYIVMAQDPSGGGWRYLPRQPGDTSVVGWQLMALKSAHMAYLRVPPETVAGASRFLDEVQDNYGATYGYTGPGAGAATTAIGLLCRLYLGWAPAHDGIQRGVQILERMGPSINGQQHAAGRNNMYYNYYATQVMHHVGGYPWQQWNAIMRDYLVKSQSLAGHEAGSWYFDGNDMGSSDGGRLYCTSMAAMILEVYYRHLPLYRQQSVLDKFGK